MIQFSRLKLTPLVKGVTILADQIKIKTRPPHKMFLPKFSQSLSYRNLDTNIEDLANKSLSTGIYNLLTKYITCLDTIPLFQTEMPGMIPH